MENKAENIVKEFLYMNLNDNDKRKLLSLFESNDIAVISHNDAGKIYELSADIKLIGIIR